MKRIAEYLDQALQFEQMAREESDETFKKHLLKQAAAYRKLATDGAIKLNLPLPPQSNRDTTK